MEAASDSPARTPGPFLSGNCTAISSTAGTKVAVLPRRLGKPLGAALAGGFRPSQRFFPPTLAAPRSGNLLNATPCTTPHPSLTSASPGDITCPHCLPSLCNMLAAQTGETLWISDLRINKLLLRPSPLLACCSRPPQSAMHSRSVVLCSPANLAARLCCYYQHLRERSERSRL